MARRWKAPRGSWKAPRGSSRGKTWKKGKVFTKGRKKVRYIYPNGKKKGRKLVSASSKRRR